MSDARTGTSAGGVGVTPPRLIASPYGLAPEIPPGLQGRELGLGAACGRDYSDGDPASRPPLSALQRLLNLRTTFARDTLPSVFASAIASSNCSSDTPSVIA